ncbi:hypothetical protein Tco_0583477 [Tanacetum coccineum]
MVSTMTTRNAGRCTVATRGGGTSEQDGREGGGQNGQESDQGSQGSSQGNGANGGGGVPDFATIIEFMACNPKEYDRKGGAIFYTRWIEKKESVQDMSGYGENQKVQTRGREAAVGITWEDFTTLAREELCLNNEIKKLETEFWYHAMIRAGHVAYTDRLNELSRLVPYLVTPKNKRIERYIYDLAPPILAMVAATEQTTIQSAVLKAGMLTDEAIRNGALKKISKKRGNNRESSRDGNARDDNKRSRTGMAFTITTNPVRKEYTGNAPKCINCNYHHQPKVPCRLCTNCNRFGYLAKDCRVGPRVLNSLNARNSTAARGSYFECSGRGNNGDQARGRAFMMGAGEALQDLNCHTPQGRNARRDEKRNHHNTLTSI